MNYRDSNPIVVEVVMSAEYRKTERKWNLRIQQIPCDLLSRGLYKITCITNEYMKFDLRQTF